VSAQTCPSIGPHGEPCIFIPGHESSGLQHEDGRGLHWGPACALGHRRASPCPKCHRPRTDKGHGIALFGGNWYFVCQPEEIDGYQEPAAVLERCERVDFFPGEPR